MSKISALPPLAAPDGSETVVVVHGGETKRATLTDLTAAAVAPIRQDVDELGFSAPLGPLIDGERPIREARDAEGRLIEAVTAEGGHFIQTPAGTRRVGAEQSDAAPIGPMVEGETPIITRTDTAGRVVEVVTKEGGRWLPSPTGLARTTPAGPKPTRYAGPDWTVNTIVPEIVRAPIDEDVWHLFFVLGQSNAMAQNVSNDPLVATVPLYPEHAFCFAGGPRRLDAIPNRTLVPIVETTTIGQRETCASGWANHFIRNMEAATGVRPRVLAVVTALGSQPLFQLSRGTPTYANFLRAIDDAVEAIRAKGGRRIITHMAWIQGASDNMGYMTPTRRLGNLQAFARQCRADIMSRTGEVEPCPFFVVNESLQVNPDPWVAPIRDADQACHGLDEMRLVGPTYPYPFIDGLHLTCRGQNRMGQQLARVSASEGFAQGWRAVRPTRWYWTSTTQFTVEFDMMVPPLVLDTSGAVVSTAGLASAGFMFRDPAPIAISAVTVGDVPYYGPGMALRFTLASAPTGRRPQLGYAIARGASQTGPYPGNSGPTEGMRGLLRDSAADVNLYDGATQANWAPSFVIDLP
jgi:hypothetical protein